MPKPPNPERRSEASRQAILAAALELCAEHGIGRLTVEGIAERASVSKKTIYRWWPSRGAVLLEAAEQTATAAAGFPDTGDIAADLRSQLQAVIELLTPPSTSAVAGLINESQRDPGLAVAVREANQQFIDRFKDRMRRAQEHGQVAADADLNVALDLLYGPIYHRLAFHLDLPDPTYLDLLIAHVLRALAPRATEGWPAPSAPIPRSSISTYQR